MAGDLDTAVFTRDDVAFLAVVPVATLRQRYEVAEGTKPRAEPTRAGAGKLQLRYSAVDFIVTAAAAGMSYHLGVAIPKAAEIARELEFLWRQYLDRSLKTGSLYLVVWPTGYPQDQSETGSEIEWMWCAENPALHPQLQRFMSFRVFDVGRYLGLTLISAARKKAGLATEDDPDAMTLSDAYNDAQESTENAFREE